MSNKKRTEPGPKERARRAERAQRLREAIAHCGVSQAELSRAANVSPGTLTDALTGTGSNGTSGRTWRKLAAALRHHAYWLQTGMGPPLMTDEEAEAEILELKLQSQAKLLPVSTDGVERWLTEWADLLSITPDERGWLRRFPWRDPEHRYSDMVYKSALDAYRMMQEKAANAS